jgi:hypothetical protein
MSVLFCFRSERVKLKKNLEIAYTTWKIWMKESKTEQIMIIFVLTRLNIRSIAFSFFI